MGRFKGNAEFIGVEDCQLHHLIPLEVFRSGRFRSFFEIVGRNNFKINDFGTNGVMLPATERCAAIMKMPMHRGPHPRYSTIVAERVSAIARDMPVLEPQLMQIHAGLTRLRLLQRALRTSLLNSKPAFCLNKRDPRHLGVDFSQIEGDLRDNLANGLLD